MLLSLLLIPLLGIFLVLCIKNNVLSVTYTINDKEEDNINDMSLYSNNEKNSVTSNETTFLSTKFLDDKEEYNSNFSNLSLSDLESNKNNYLSLVSSNEIASYWKHCTEKIKTSIYEPYYLGNSKNLVNNILSGNSYKNTIKYVVLSISVLNLFISLIIFILFDYSTNQLQFVQDYHEISFFNLYLGIDGLSIYFVLLTTIIIPVSLLSNWKSISKIVESYVIIMLLLETLLLAVFLVLDVLLFYIFFESILPPLFILIGLFGSNNRVKASFYLFLYTLLGSLFLLLSILSMSSLMGTTDYDTLYKGNINYSTQLFIFYGIFIAFAVKTPTIFLNTWLLKAHVESPLGGSILLAGIVLKLSLYGILRLILPTLPKAYLEYTFIIYVIGFITILYASISTLRTIDVKELIAYSSVSHAAVYLVGILSNVLQGIEGAILLGIGHGFVSPGLFICGGGVLYDRSSSRLLSFYKGMAQLMPLFAILFFILCLGNCGAPLTLNFVGEFLSLYGVFERLPLMGAMCSISIVLSAAYTMYMYNRISFGGKFSNLFTINIPDLTKREFHLLLTLVVLTVFFGIYPISLFKAMDYSVSTVLYLGNSVICDASINWGLNFQDINSLQTVKDIYGDILETFYLILLVSFFFLYIYTELKPSSIYKHFSIFLIIKKIFTLILEYTPIFVWLSLIILYNANIIIDYLSCFNSYYIDIVAHLNEVVLNSIGDSGGSESTGDGNDNPSDSGGPSNSSGPSGSEDPHSSGNTDTQNEPANQEGLAEAQTATERIAYCEHRSRNLQEFFTDENHTLAIPCDFDSGQGEHNAVDGPLQSAWLCSNCHALICTNCRDPNSDSDKDSGLGDTE